MNEFIAIRTVENAIRRLADLSPDGAFFRNDVGFNGTHAVAGRRLAASVGFWGPEELLAAAEICQTYRNTQLHGLEVPTPDELRTLPKVAEFLAAQKQAKIEATLESGFGLDFGPAKVVRLADGRLRQVENAVPNEAFWAAWRAGKDAIKAAGFSVSRDPRSTQWLVARWSAAPEGATATNAGSPSKNGFAARKAAAAEALAQRPLDESKLLSYQPLHVRNLAAAYVANGGYLWDGSDLGTGKTYAACAFARWAGFRRIRVVTPKAVIPDWYVAAKHVGVELASVTNWEAVRRGTDYCIREKVGRAEKFTWTDTDFVIFDEAHNAKGNGTLNSLLLRGARDSGVEGLLLSGTLGHEPQEFRAANHFLGVSHWNNHFDWVVQNGCVRGNWGIEFPGTDAEKRAKMAALRGSYVPKRGARVSQKDLPPGAFPETEISVYLAGGDEQTRAAINAAYDELAAELAALAERSKNDGGSSGGAEALVALLRALQKCELLLVPTLVGLAIENWEDNERKTAIFLTFRESIAAARKLLAERTGRADVPVVIGGQAAETRRAGIDRYNADEVPWILVGTAAGGTGLSLHHRRDLPSDALVTPNASAVKIKQVLGRVHRAGGKSTSIQRIVCIEGTKQAEMLSRCASKIACMAAFNDADLHGSLVPEKGLEEKDGQ